MIADLVLAVALAHAASSSAELVPAPFCAPGPPIVYFERGEARLSKRQQAILDFIATPFIRDRLRTRILVTGHSDAIGGKAANLALSRRRALAVRAYLLRKGVAASRIETRAMGESDPIVAAAEDPDGKYSRRVGVIEMVAPEERDRRLAAWPKGVVC